MNLQAGTLFFLFAFIVSLGTGACAESPLERSGGGISLTRAGLTGCDLPNGDNLGPSGTGKIVLRVTGGALEAPLVRAYGSVDDGGNVEFDEIPPGDNMSVEVVACSNVVGSEDTPTWAGVTHGFDIAEIGDTATVEVFLTAPDLLASAGRCSKLASPEGGHAFGSTFENSIYGQ